MRFKVIRISLALRLSELDVMYNF